MGKNYEGKSCWFNAMFEIACKVYSGFIAFVTGRYCWTHLSRLLWSRMTQYNRLVNWFAVLLCRHSSGLHDVTGRTAWLNVGPHNITETPNQSTRNDEIISDPVFHVWKSSRTREWFELEASSQQLLTGYLMLMWNFVLRSSSDQNCFPCEGLEVDGKRMLVGKMMRCRLMMSYFICLTSWRPKLIPIRFVKREQRANNLS